ncbi:MarR family transcriptional regulator [Actinomycetospora sp. TBRC 11914]|uniref:MarR family winged helix-turn-helix transcriptional regulator n=1 Tax=Actinomycetospora sp. TBRC 11914 TaxID=2729387 RepID=UPI00289A3EFF|nr:MarR family transcriptional regulator [Actinomycetospora sp. TBRC 11914]
MSAPSTPSPSADVPVRLRLAVGRLNRRLRAVTGAGLHPLQTSALATLSDHGRQRLGDLARLEGVTAPTMSRTVAALEAAGLVHRVPDPADARSAWIALTDTGTAALAAERVDRAVLLEAGMDRLAPDQREALRRALPALEALAALPR